MLLTKDQKKAALAIIASIKSDQQDYSLQAEQIEQIDEFFDHLFLCAIVYCPQLITNLGLFESMGIREHNAYLNNVLPQTYLKIFEQKEKNLKLLKKFDLNKLNPDQVISCKIFLWYLEHQVSGQKFIFHQYYVNQMMGILTDLTYLFTLYHPIEIEEDVEYYLARLEKIVPHLEQLHILLEHQRALNITVPAFVIPKIVASLEQLLPENQTDNIFYTHLQNKLIFVSSSSAQKFLKRAHTILAHKVYPAFTKIKDYYKTHSTGNTHINGVWALPDGCEYYAHILKYHITTDLSPDEVHEIGLKEVFAIQQQIREILCAEGFANTHNESISQLLKDAIHSRPLDYSNDEAGKAKCLADYEKIILRAREQLYPLFNLRPKSQLKLEAVPKHEEEGQPAAYYAPPSMDGSRPGIFFVNLRNMEELRSHGMETLAIHEAEPGHHFQIALQQEMDVPMMRQLFEGTAFVEGWALYTEKLAYEQGFYSSAMSKVGHLQDELMRAARLVVDTGIHHKKWTREQAIEYMHTNTGMHIDSVITEVERYFVMPGQACAYKIGQLKILELRKKAQETLKEKFDIREFHDAVLTLGAAPLVVLEEVINEYIQKKLSYF